MLNHVTNSDRKSQELRGKPSIESKIAAIVTKVINISRAENFLISEPIRFSSKKIRYDTNNRIENSLVKVTIS